MRFPPTLRTLYPGRRADATPIGMVHAKDDCCLEEREDGDALIVHEEGVGPERLCADGEDLHHDGLAEPEGEVERDAVRKALTNVGGEEKTMMEPMAATSEGKMKTLK